MDVTNTSVIKCLMGDLKDCLQEKKSMQAEARRRQSHIPVPTSKLSKAATSNEPNKSQSSQPPTKSEPHADESPELPSDTDDSGSHSTDLGSEDDDGFFERYEDDRDDENDSPIIGF